MHRQSRSIVCSESNVLFNSHILQSSYALNMKTSTPSLRQTKMLNQCIYKKLLSQTFQCSRCKYAEGRVCWKPRGETRGPLGFKAYWSDCVITTNHSSRSEWDGRVVISTWGKCKKGTHELDFPLLFRRPHEWRWWRKSLWQGSSVFFQTRTADGSLTTYTV